MSQPLGPITPVLADPRSLPPELVGLTSALSSDPEEIQRRVTHRRPTREGSRRASVLVMIGTEDFDITFTERAHTMRKHPGQISFPGGSLEPGEGAVEAALREAWEEIGLAPSRAQVMGRLPAAHVRASAFDVAAIVAAWDGEADNAVVPVDAAEVAAVHRYRIEDLADPSNRVTAVLPQGYSGPAFTMGEIFIWGFTAHLTDILLDLGGWSREWDSTREVPVPRRFLRD